MQASSQSVIPTMVRCTSCGGPANPDEGVVEVISPLRLVTLGKLLNLQIVNLVKMVSIVKLLSKPLVSLVIEAMRCNGRDSGNCCDAMQRAE